MLRVRTTLLLALSLAAADGLAPIAAFDGAQAVPSSIRWSVPVSARPATPPVISGSLVFVVLESGVVAAHHVADGRQVWRVELRADQPVAVDGMRLYVASGDAIHALDTADGSTVWRVASAALTAPLVAHEGWVIATSTGSLVAMRGADGTVVWSRENSARHAPATIDGDNLYVPQDDGRLLALDLRTGADRWARRFTGPLTEVLALTDRVYFGAADKNFYCLNSENGHTVWKFQIGTMIRGRPAADGTRVFVTGMDNVLRAFDRRSGALPWHKGVPFRPTRGPALVGSAVLVSGSGADVMAFESGAGREAGKIALGEALALPPAFAEVDRAVVMAAFTGGLHEQWKLVLTERSTAARRCRWCR